MRCCNWHNTGYSCQYGRCIHFCLFHFSFKFCFNRIFNCIFDLYVHLTFNDRLYTINVFRSARRGNSFVNITGPLSNVTRKRERSNKTGYNWRVWFVNCYNNSTSPICSINPTNIRSYKTIHLFNSCIGGVLYDQTIEQEFIFDVMVYFSLFSSGIVGWIMLNTPISTNVSLLTIFSGLFGVSTLIYSLTQNAVVPSQDTFHNFKVNKKVLRGIFAGGIAGSILGFLPGMGPAQGSILAQELSGGGDIGENREGFLVAMSGVNVSDALFSLIAIYLIGNPRSGIAVYIDKLIQNFDLNYLLLFVFVSLLAVSLSVFFCLKLGDLLIIYLNEIDYSRLSKLVILFMSILVIIFAIIENVNILYILLVYITSISLGLIPHYIGVNKSNLMGVLILPAIVIYTGIG